MVGDAIVEVLEGVIISTIHDVAEDCRIVSACHPHLRLAQAFGLPTSTSLSMHRFCSTAFVPETW